MYLFRLNGRRYAETERNENKLLISIPKGKEKVRCVANEWNLWAEVILTSVRRITLLNTRDFVELTL